MPTSFPCQHLHTSQEAPHVQEPVFQQQIYIDHICVMELNKEPLLNLQAVKHSQDHNVASVSQPPSL